MGELGRVGDEVSDEVSCAWWARRKLKVQEDRDGGQNGGENNKL